MDNFRIDMADMAELETPVATYGAGMATTDGTFELIVNILVYDGRIA